MLKIIKQQTVLISRCVWEEGAGYGQRVEAYTLEDGTRVIYHPDYEEYLDATGEIYEPVGNPVEGFVNVGCTTLPATTADEDVFLLVEKALGAS